jgi:hypothetical protein
MDLPVFCSKEEQISQLKRLQSSKDFPGNFSVSPPLSVPSHYIRYDIIYSQCFYDVILVTS